MLCSLALVSPKGIELSFEPIAAKPGPLATVEINSQISETFLKLLGTHAGGAKV